MAKSERTAGVKELSRIVKALGVALRNGSRSFWEYYCREFDPLTRDELTRTWNRPCFERRRRRLKSYALLLIDIDNFKQINDHHGHSVGDTVLREVGSTLRTGSGDRVFRVGGEEFAVLLKTDRAGAAAVAERLCGLVRGLCSSAGLAVSVSIGVAWREQTDQTEALDHVEVYRLADAALYRAKGRGKDRVVMMDEVPLAADPFDRSSETPEPTRPRREISGGIGRGAPSLADLRRSRGLFSDAA